MQLPWQTTENERIAAHLLRAEGIARSRDVTRLSPLQRLVRALLVQELKSYRKAKRFPVNPDFTEATPYFVDAAGTPCAVAHLLAMSGEGQLVSKIARERNNARVHELASEPALVAWLRAAALTLEEAALIQPTYKHYRGECVCGFEPIMEPLSGAKPADGVLVGEALDDPSSIVQRMRITSTYGDPGAYAVGQEVAVQDIRYTWGDDKVPAGTLLVVPVHRSDEGEESDAGMPILPAIALDEDGSFSCTTESGTVGPMSVEQLSGVLQASDCDRALGKLNRDWVKRSSTGDMGACALAQPAGTNDSSATLGVLLALVAAMAARRATR